MKKAIELPLAEPIYCTYHSQGTDGAVFAGNPSIRNWYYNHLSMLYCNKKFLRGYTTPELFVFDSYFWENPYLELSLIPIRHLGNSVHKVMRALMNDNYYIYFMGIDDFYIKGKSWYQQRHFMHDGLIYGYDQTARTYSIYAYDQSWRYRKFKISQNDFEEGRKSAISLNSPLNSIEKIFIIRPKQVTIELNPIEIFDNIREYLGYSFRKEYTYYMNKMVFGIETHDYLTMYLTMLANGDIPYEKMDWRVFRQLWEHKKVMQERIAAVEQQLSAPSTISDKYAEVVKWANEIRMLYAAHHKRRKDSVLPVIREKLLDITEREYKLLYNFLELDKR